MHPNNSFRQTPKDRSLQLVRERSFGTLALNDDAGPLLAHIPFLLSDDGAQAELHLVRSNSIARALPAQATLAVMGPDSYVSPDWYGVPDQVPTWNYVAVHLKGWLELRPQDALHGLLDRQTALFEDQLQPKPPWLSSKMGDGVMERMLRAIVPAVLHIKDVESTWKLGQNKPDDVRERAASEIGRSGLGVDPPALAALMKSPPEG